MSNQQHADDCAYPEECISKGTVEIEMEIELPVFGKKTVTKKMCQRHASIFRESVLTDVSIAKEN